MANDFDSNSGTNTRLGDYKCRKWKNDQESRRIVLLQEQKRRRDESVNSRRNFNDIFNDENESPTEDSEMGVCDEGYVKKPTDKKPKDLLMFSEWMTEVPPDLQDKWLFMVCPVGKRCVVRSCKGLTIAYNKKGQELARFHSALPSGSPYENSEMKYSRSNVTVLDCIWCSSIQKYFILDVLYWKDQSCLDTDVWFRDFWIKSKIVEEMPWILEKSKQNPFPFIPLNRLGCDAMSLSTVMSKFPHFQGNQPEVDGILFYHVEGYYTSGMTPLVLWLKPFMLQEILGQDVIVAEKYYDTRPEGYINRYDYISQFDEAQAKKKRQRWRRRKATGEVDELEQMDSIPCG